MENRENKLDEDEMDVTEKKEDKQLTVTTELEIVDGLKEESDLSSDKNGQSTGMETMATVAYDSGDNEEEFGGDDDNESDSDLNSKSDDDGWITPDNISSVKDEMGRGGFSVAPASSVTVGCLTTDFAIQVISFLNSLFKKKMPGPTSSTLVTVSAYAIVSCTLTRFPSSSCVCVLLVH